MSSDIGRVPRNTVRAQLRGLDREMPFCLKPGFWSSAEKEKPVILKPDRVF
jgi:hypothetical protein